MTHEYNIGGITCNGCIAKVKGELSKIQDITNLEVQIAAPQATITMQKHIPFETLRNAIAQLGPKYSISEVASVQHMAMPVAEEKTSDSYYPIFLIFGFITGVSLLVQFMQPQFSIMQWMSHFMAGFFLVFSFFKLLNLQGFAEGYKTYDVVAKQVPAFGFVYPFIELGLGIAFLTGFAPMATNIITFVIMAVSIIGVAQSLLKKTPFQCACLGTIIKLPLSKVTFFEDLLMIVMSGVMIAML